MKCCRRVSAVATVIFGPYGGEPDVGRHQVDVDSVDDELDAVTFLDPQRGPDLRGHDDTVRRTDLHRSAFCHMTILCQIRRMRHLAMF